MTDSARQSSRPGANKRAAIAIACVFGLLALVAAALVWGLKATERPDTLMNTTPGGHNPPAASAGTKPDSKSETRSDTPPRSEPR